MLNEELSIIHLEGRPDLGTFWTTHAQRLPDGGYALASSRSKAGERNLQLFDDSCRFKTSFPIGDGVEHLAVDRTGKLWVGYFDEGIFGGDPLSSAGLSRFDQSGKLEYQWDASTHGRINDCDALTVDDDGAAWVCPYSSYFVASILDADVQIVIREAPVSVISGLLIARTHVAFIGGTDFHGVGDKNGVVIHVSSGEGWIEELPKVGPDPTNKESVVTIVSRLTGERTQVQILDENASPLAFRNNVSCRSGTAVCWNKEHVYRFNLESLLSA